MSEPEVELVRRALPYALPAAAIAFGLGALAGGPSVGWSAAIGVGIVAANFTAHGLSLAWGARISPTVMFAVGLGGYVVRLAIIVLAMVALNALEWFSPVAFLAAVVPATTALLAFEMKLLGGRLQADLWSFPSEKAAR